MCSNACAFSPEYASGLARPYRCPLRCCVEPRGARATGLSRLPHDSGTVRRTMSGAVLLCGDECESTRVCLVEEERDVDGSHLHVRCLDKWDGGRSWRSRA